MRPMKTPKIHVGRLLLFGILSCLDLVLTFRLLHSGGGYVYESNPIANEWLTRFGFAGLALFKILAMSTAAISVIVVSCYRPHVGSRLLTFACVVVSVVVVYSFSLSNVIGSSLETDDLLSFQKGGLSDGSAVPTRHPDFHDSPAEFQPPTCGVLPSGEVCEGPQLNPRGRSEYWENP